MNFGDIKSRLASTQTPLAVCAPEDKDTMQACYEASNLGFVKCILVGDQKAIKTCIDQYTPGFNPEVVDAATHEEAAFKSVQLIREKKAAALMKGSLSTPILLKAVLNNETGIKDSNILSHAMIFEWENRLKIITDGGMLPHPTLEEKIEILKNAKNLAKKLGLELPRIAVLSAVEKVNLKMPSTVDAAIISKMGERKQFGSDCLVEGPLALDNAISIESAHHKGLYNEVVGEADIFVVPDIDSGNVLGKTILYYTKCPSGGLIIGAKCPVVLLSRSDDKQTRLNSIMLALAAN